MVCLMIDDDDDHKALASEIKNKNKCILHMQANLTCMMCLKITAKE